jgi:hypothetical protein
MLSLANSETFSQHPHRVSTRSLIGDQAILAQLLEQVLDSFQLLL